MEYEEFWASGEHDDLRIWENTQQAISRVNGGHGDLEGPFDKVQMRHYKDLNYDFGKWEERREK